MDVARGIYIILFLVSFISASALCGQSLSRGSNSPDNVDSELDCAIKEFALHFASIIQPWKVNQQDISDALQYERCKSYSTTTKFSKNTRPARTKSSTISPSIQIYVDASKGNDSNNGTIRNPLKTISAAVSVYRRLKTSRCISGVIILNPGEYYLTEPVRLYPQDSYLQFQGTSNDQVIVSGGKKYNFTWKLYKTVVTADTAHVNVAVAATPGGGVIFHGVTSSYVKCRVACEVNSSCLSFTWFDATSGIDFAQKCYLRTDEQWSPHPWSGARSGRKLDIYMTDLSKQNPVSFTSLFIDGRRAVRARYPNGNPETSGLHTMPSGYTTAVKWLPPLEKPPAKEILIDSPQRNGTHFPTFQIGIGGPVDIFEPPESYWGTSKPVGGGGSTYTMTTGLQYDIEEDFTHRNWSDPKTGVVHALHCEYWGGWQFAVDNRDMEHRTITWSYGGFQESRGCAYGQEYYIENIKEELDVPGEWFYAEKEMVLYYIPNGTLPTNGIGTSLTRLFSIEGFQDDPVYNISLTDMTLAHTQPTFLMRYEVPSAGDWGIRREGAVFVEGADGIRVENCVFDSPGGNGLFLSRYIRNAVVMTNEFKYVGDSAIALIGSVQLMDGTDGNQPRGTLVSGNLMREFGIWGKQTAAFMQSLSAETTFEKNIFFNCPRAGININDGFGGGNLFRWNLGFNTVRETSDHGVFNSWDRQPYLTEVGDDKMPSLIPAVSNVTKNFLISNYHAVWPLDHDDGSCYYLDTDNYLVYGGYKNYLGHSKVFHNNYYIYPDALTGYSTMSRPFCVNSDGASIDMFPSGWGEVWTNNTCITGNPHIYDFDNCEFSTANDLSRLLPLTANNNLYAPNKDVYIRCGSNEWTLDEFQAMGFDLGTKVEDVVDTGTIIEWGQVILPHP